MTFRFAPSQLNLIHECPRCFWRAHVAGIPRPRGIFPGVLGVIDRLIQRETSNYAGANKPVWVLPELEGGAIRQGPKRFETHGDNWVLNGIVDDLILMENGMVIIIDYKTAKPYTQEKAEKYYQLQLDCYKLLLEANNLCVSDTAYLIFTIPVSFIKKTHTKHFSMSFEVTPIALSVSAHRARESIGEALKICALPTSPRASPECKFCRYIEQQIKRT